MTYQNSYDIINQQSINININLKIQKSIQYIKNITYNNNSNINNTNISYSKISYSSQSLTSTINRSHTISSNNSIDALVDNIQPTNHLPILYDNSSSMNNLNNSYNQTNYCTPKNNNSYDVACSYLNPIRPATQFINEAWQIQDYIKQTFKTLMNKDFPNNIIVKVCDKQTMKLICEQNNSKFKEGTLGFAINNNQNNNLNSQVFILQNNLDKMMLVIGHEIGHVLSHRLNNPHNEEAKAFAFELAWATTIKENNIANLNDSINLNLKPARNGLHDVAFNFVLKHIKNGTKALDLFWMFIKNNLTVTNNSNNNLLLE